MPRGTCYTAEEPLGTFVEVFRDFGTLTDAFVDQFALSTLEIQSPIRIADCTVRRALPHGVTLAVFGSTDYVNDTQPLVLALADAGFEGIRYRVRHDPETSLVAVGLFGRAGAATGILVAATTSIPVDIIELAESDFDISVLPIAGL